MSEIQIRSYFLSFFFVNVCIFFAIKKMTMKVLPQTFLTFFSVSPKCNPFSES